jgi:hypothetical protein
MERARAVTQSLLLVKCIMAAETLSIGRRLRINPDGRRRAG